MKSLPPSSGPSDGESSDKPHLGLHLLTLEFLMTFETVEKNRKSFVKFRLFGKSFGCDFYHFSELLDFSKSSFKTKEPQESLQIKGEVNILRGEKHFNFKNYF
jgi:hypothetical protein